MPKLTYKEVLLLQSWARTAWKEISLPCTIDGAGIDLPEGDLLTIAHLQAGLQFMNSRGLLVPDWQEKFSIELFHRTSEPDFDYREDDEPKETPKKKKV